MSADVAGALARDLGTMSDVDLIRETLFTPTSAYEHMARRDAAAAALDRLVAERDEAQLRASINGLGSEPSEAGGPGKEEAYWQRRKLDAAIRHMRDLEDYFRLAGGTDDSPNMIRADRVRAIYEQISDDYLNGKTYRPTMKERAEAAEAEIELVVEWFVQKPWSELPDPGDFGGHPYSENERAIGYGTYRDPRFLPPSLARAAIAGEQP